MKNSNLGARITLWANRFIAITVAALVFLLPTLVDWYGRIRALTASERTAITVAFYCCAAVIAVALWQIDRLLCDILCAQVFTRKNVKRIRAIRWCCGMVSLICVPAAFAYIPLIFLVIIMAFLCLVVSVVAGVMNAAVIIREENDLTI